MTGQRKFWFKKGLQFDCTGCGACCGGEPGGYVWVDKNEIRALARYLGMSEEEFAMKYLKNVDGYYSLLILPEGNCVFLKDNACSVYPARPFQCSSFPFWPHVLDSRRKWDQRAEKCPGMNRGTMHPLHKIIKTLVKFRERYGM